MGAFESVLYVVLESPLRAETGERFFLRFKLVVPRGQTFCFKATVDSA